MAIHDLDGFGEERESAAESGIPLSSAPASLRFLDLSGAWLSEDAVRNRHLADIVQERATSDDSNLIHGKSHCPSNSYGECRDPL